MCPYRGLNPQPRYVPWLGIKPRNFWSTDDGPTNWATQPGLAVIFKTVYCKHYTENKIDIVSPSKTCCCPFPRLYPVTQRTGWTHTPRKGTGGCRSGREDEVVSPMTEGRAINPFTKNNCGSVNFVPPKICNFYQYHFDWSEVLLSSQCSRTKLALALSAPEAINTTEKPGCADRTSKLQGDLPRTLSLQGFLHPKPEPLCFFPWSLCPSVSHARCEYFYPGDGRWIKKWSSFEIFWKWRSFLKWGNWVEVTGGEKRF